MINYKQNYYKFAATNKQSKITFCRNQNMIKKEP